MPVPTEGKTTVLLQPSRVAFSNPFFDRQTHKKRGFARSACQAAKPCLSDPTDITHPSLQPPAPCWNSAAEGMSRATELPSPSHLGFGCLSQVSLSTQPHKPRFSPVHNSFHGFGLVTNQPFPPSCSPLRARFHF